MIDTFTQSFVLRVMLNVLSGKLLSVMLLFNFQERRLPQVSRWISSWWRSQKCCCREFVVIQKRKWNSGLIKTYPSY